MICTHKTFIYTYTKGKSRTIGYIVDHLRDRARESPSLENLSSFPSYIAPLLLPIARARAFFLNIIAHRLCLGVYLATDIFTFYFIASLCARRDLKIIYGKYITLYSRDFIIYFEQFHRRK